jgi:MEDS: MEthanogen/methylotroph, DcmR Sensory domain
VPEISKRADIVRPPVSSLVGYRELQMLHNPETSGHFVQFYVDDAFVIENVSYLAERALSAGNSSVLIATESHLRAIENRLTQSGVDLEQPRYVALDAESTLSRFLVDGWPNEARFNETVGEVIRSATEKSENGFVLAFGEMVALLCAADKADAALCLEQLWNSLAEVYRFSLCCAYPMDSFGNEPDLDVMLKICSEHSLAIPA